jgi:hypothetical protein
MVGEIPEHDIVAVRRDGDSFAVCEYVEGMLHEIEPPRPREHAEELAKRIAEENGGDAWVLELPLNPRRLS